MRIDLKALGLLLVLGLMVAAAPGMAEAGTFTATFPEYNGATYDYGTTFPLPPVTVATETIPSSGILSATFSGIFGSTSTYYGSTAEFDLYLNGSKVGSTYDVTPDPFNNVVPFSFTVSPSILTGGSATLSLVQESPYNIRLSSTTLTITTGSVPEPSTLTLAGTGILVCLGAWVRQRAR